MGKECASYIACDVKLLDYREIKVVLRTQNWVPECISCREQRLEREVDREGAGDLLPEIVARVTLPLEREALEVVTLQEGPQAFWV